MPLRLSFEFYLWIVPLSFTIAALNPDTGKLIWASQPSHGTHDWDAIEVPVMVDADFHGKPRKLLMQASRTATSSCSIAPTAKAFSSRPFGPVKRQDAGRRSLRLAWPERSFRKERCSV